MLESMSTSLAAKPIVTVNEARKILGKEAEDMSNDDIKRLIQAFDSIATLIIRNYSVPKCEVKKVNK
jgi:hypothetical protein